MANTAYIYITKDINLNDYEEIDRISSCRGSNREFFARHNGYLFLEEVIEANRDEVAIHIEEATSAIFIMYYNKTHKEVSTIEFYERIGDVYKFDVASMPKYIQSKVLDIIELDDIIIK